MSESFTPVPLSREYRTAEPLRRTLPVHDRKRWVKHLLDRARMMATTPTPKDDDVLRAYERLHRHQTSRQESSYSA